MDEPVRVVPSLRRCLWECAWLLLVAVGGMAAVAALGDGDVLDDSRGVAKHVVKWLGVALVLAVVRLVRFLRKAPRSVEADSQGLWVDRRGGSHEFLAWSEVREAHHEAKRGKLWRFVREEGTFELRDDGITSPQWTRLTRAVHAALSRRDVEVTGVAPETLAEDAESAAPPAEPAPAFAAAASSRDAWDR